MYLKSSLFALLLATSTAHALGINGQMIRTIPVATPAGTVAQKQVVLMKLKMTPQEATNFLSYNTKPYVSKLADLPDHVDLGMNNVPVLDQGMNGTCATFANTAALDALLGKGDYVSQLCFLNVDQTLAKTGYIDSAWFGSFGPYILDEIRRFGIINKATQHAKSCGGVKEYPIDGGNYGKPIPLNKAKTMSEPAIEDLNANRTIYWEALLNSYQRTSVWWRGNETDPGDALIDSMKQALANRTDENDLRFTFGVLLPVNHCFVGACAKHTVNYDTWAMADEIKNDPNPYIGGHEMIIYGYDDNATATDNKGVVHKGLFLLRNSWGSGAGDEGNYYMTYDFFKKFVLEVQKLRTVNRA